ncbi:MAG: amino acid adenylation domain-containing protein, partial [Halanaerobiales bacterium]|nr:amino acid adenylation domain-containing protein [Halanaerobiales bacterium]
NIPIGKPISNSQVYILDKNNQLQPSGVLGELCIGGEGLARGYLNRPELTQEKFIENPFIPNEKMYKTGDLARWLPNGNIEFLGRVDYQVKIRGFRIELGEIEERLARHAEIKEVVVLDRVDTNGTKYLCAYFVADRKISASELRTVLFEELPDYMIPSYFINLKKMPLTSNGKIDRRELPEPDGNIHTGKEYVAPTNEEEEAMVRIWMDILSVKQIGINDDFFELGGHSLKATQLTSKVLKEFNAELPLKEIFSRPTVKELVAYLSKTDETLYAAIEPVEENEYACSSTYLVSSAQKRLFALYQMEGENITYNSPNMTVIEGKLDKGRLYGVIKALIQRHEALRTSFAVIDGKAVQIIHPDVDFNVAYYEKAENELGQIINEFIQPFDLSKPPLCRAGLVKFAEDRHLLMLDMHHIISDGTSMSIFFTEFVRLYDDKNLLPLRIQYKDFAVWQNKLFQSEEIQRQEDYWMDAFAEEVPVLNLPTDAPRPTERSFEGDTLNFSLNKELTDGLNELASSNGATLYMTILATLNVLLSKYSNQSDIVIGSPIAGRRHADLENIMGMFINTLALRNYPEKDKTFVQFLNEVKENAFKAYENQDYQFEMLVEKLNLQRDLSRNPLFDVMFILQNTATVDGQIRDLKLTSYPFETKVAQFDLVFNAFETDLGIHFNLEYATKLFKRETIERMVDHLRKAIRQVLKNPVQLISEIEIISVEEKQQLLVDFNNTEVEIKAQTIGEMFEEQVIKTPDNIVGVFGEKHLTYSELNYKANQIARVLREKGVKPEQIVGIMVERSLEMMIGLLGIFKSGGAYLPIDPVYPEERIEYMLEDSQVKIVLTQNHLKDKLQMLNRDLLSLDDEELYKGEMSNLGKINSPHDLAYVIYTSGSTGKPKAVMIEHRNIVNTIVWRKNELQLSSNDKVLQLLSYSFDGFVVNFLTPIISGAQLIMLSNEDYKDPIAIKEVIRKRGITHFNCVPSLFSALLDCLTPKDAKTLRMIALGGEQITANLIERSKKVNSDLEIINEYGPTESSVIATALRGIQADSIIPIGRPIANTRIYIVDFAMKLVPVGVAGELCISGDGLARGYMNRPELVAEKFVQNPLEEKMYRTGDLARWLPNGMIEFLGRIDYQVKIRGYRIEIGEIEAQLLTHEAVREVVVTDREGVDGAKYLCAYFVSSKKLIGPELKSYLSSLLPEYMIPAFFIHLEKLPLTTNGKIDRRALPEPDGTVGTEYIPPTTESEEKMAKIWSAILGREKVGINDNFFELGGDSIKAIQIIARANQHEINISVKDIFKYKTIAEILRNVDYNKHVFAISQEEVVGEVLFTPVQKWFFDLSLDHGHFWNQTNLFTLRDDVDFKMLENVFKKLIAHHDALRMGYQFDGEYVIQFNRSIAEVDFKLERVDLSEYTYNIQQQKFKEACIKVQDQFDLEKDLLLKAVVFDLGKKGKRLFISIHHLVIDGVSWRILLEDLQNLYNSNLQVELPLKTTSFKEWSEQLRQYVKTEELDVSYWKKIDQSTLKSLIDVEIKENYLGDQQRVFFELDEVQTGKLLTQINWVYNTEINDILLSALTISLTEMIQTESVLLTLEGHGREEIVENVNLSRTIGWFTAGYPVCLQRKDDIGETIKHVKENLRKIPNKGLDFGLARYLADQMLETLEAEISFNYLGQFDGVLDKTEESGQKLLAGCSEDYGTSIHERNQHPTLLDIVGMVTDGKLKMMISYNEKYLNDEWIEELRDLYNVKLIEVIEHCVKKEDKSYTVSDFEVEDVWDNEDMDLIAGLYEL